MAPARPPSRRAARGAPPRGPSGRAGLLPYDYVARTRALPVNLLFLVPFVLVYELALVATRSPVENAAAAWLRALWRSLGHGGAVAATLGVTLIYLVVVWLRAHQAARERGLFGGMLVEGTLYGLSLGFVAQVLAAHLPMGRTVPLAAQAGGALAGLSSTLRDIGLALGAGVFEEVVFRGLLLAGLVALVRHALGADRLSAGVVALLTSSYLFSAYHHWGVFGEPYHAGVFAFRFHAGLLLGTLFLTRGLGIAALTHGVYDLWVTLG